MTSTITDIRTIAVRNALGEAEVPTGIFLDGRWLDLTETFGVLNPANGETIGEISDSTDDHAAEALDLASGVSASWASWAPAKRARLMHRATDLLHERRVEIAAVMVEEAGKPKAEALGEVDLSVSFLRWYAEQVAHLHGTSAPGSNGGYRIITGHRPVGPTLTITPWNFPLLMSARKAGAALAAGCPVIIKSAKETPLTAAMFVQALADAGLPAGTVALLHTTSSAPISERLLADRRLRKLSFTGSTGAGQTLLRNAADNIVDSSMELGGDAPFVVLDDADVDKAVDQAIACKFRNSGQACVAANRFILQEGIAEEFTDKFIEKTREIIVGAGDQDDTDMGPVINERALTSLSDTVDQLQREGAELLIGGEPIASPGYFFQPTVFKMPKGTEKEIHEELFSPVATIFTVETVAEAIAAANQSPFGLAGYVFTENVSRAIAVSERLELGMVGINRGIMADPAAPFGGVKASGLGREGGHEGIYEFLEPQYLALTVDETVVE